MPTELELIALETEFDLLLPFIKRLVLSLPDSRDRVRAAMWVQSLRKVTDDNFKKLRNEHSKLLLFALHRRSLVGVFEKPPPHEIESFHDGLTLMEMTRELIEITEKQKSEASNEDPTKSPLPIVVTNISADMKQYAAAQQIPKFGAHCYMAVSNEPMPLWQKVPNVVYPDIGELPNLHIWEQAFANVDDHVLEKQAVVDKAIAIAKAIESGEMSEDELEPAIDFSKKIKVEPCKVINFKWKKDSILNTHQSYDFSDVGVAEDIVRQGKSQLELDEDAFQILDHSLPGRQRIVIRDPYYNGLPADLGDRRLHGVVDMPPDVEDDEEGGDNCCAEKRSSGQRTAPKDKLVNLYPSPQNQINFAKNVECCEDMFNDNLQNDIATCDTPKFQLNFNDPNDLCNTVDQYIQQMNQFDESTPPQDLLPHRYDVQIANGYKKGKKRLTWLHKSCCCSDKQNAGTSMTRKDDYKADDETQWFQEHDFVSDVGANHQQFGNEEQQLPCKPCRSQQQEVTHGSQQQLGQCGSKQVPCKPCGGQQQQGPYRSEQQLPCKPFGGQQQVLCEQCGGRQQQVPCGSCKSQQQQIDDFQKVYNMDNFGYERGCYDIEPIDMNDFIPKLDSYDYSLNLPPPDEFNCCGVFFDPPPPESDDDRTSSCCSASGRGYY